MKAIKLIYSTFGHFNLSIRERYEPRGTLKSENLDQDDLYAVVEPDDMLDLPRVCIYHFTVDQSLVSSIFIDSYWYE